MLTHPAEARRRFREFAEEDITNANLAMGALLIALEDNPGIDVNHYLNTLDGIAERAKERGSANDPAVFRLGHLHAELFDSLGYRGDTTTYDDPKNAYLNDVIDRRRGLPITLSIVFLHVASRMGLSAAGVGLPGHYIVKVQFELNEVYVDPFQGGVTLSLNDIGSLVEQVSGGATRLSAEHLRAWGGRDTLVRVLANLHRMWTSAGDARRAASARERMEILSSRRVN